ncbi:MAG TPA: YceI family protein [Rhodocyclaceae bacterium]|nr:YceI family protein [Rhodocyclaceae bacterium]HNH34789.1 YceI family protein [Rhodocyclaceae bacterium]
MSPQVKHFLALSAVSLGLAPAAVQAVEYTQVLPEKSAVAFVYKQMNVPVEGAFKRFKGQVSFDPAKPAGARAELEIDMAGVDAGSPEANEEVAGKLWFNTKAFPTARFVSSVIKPVGKDQYEVAGKMTIKGRTVDAKAPAAFRQDGKNAVFEGAFVLKRADYGIGEGMWADFGTVANEVQIKFRLVAAPAPDRK